MDSHFVVKLCEAAQVFEMVDYVRKMTVKKSCRYDELGLFKHLLLLLLKNVWVFLCVFGIDVFSEDILFSDSLVCLFILKFISCGITKNTQSKHACISVAG